jgi:UDP-GlcNAc:undecaprenyl-phosphate GlcNAc-1-phosphate transferase
MALAFSLLFTRIVRWAADKCNIVALPDGYRKKHSGRMPLLGGVAIYFAFLAPFFGFLFHQNAISRLFFSHFTHFFALGVGATIILLLGIFDDIKSLRARWKLLFQALAALIMFFAGYRISAVSSPFGSPIQLGLLCLPVTLFWFLGASNAFNLIDGLDGLAAGVALFATATVFTISVLFGNVLCAFLTASLAGALLGFLFYNFPPASIFLGDSGSMLLGFLVAAIALRGSQKSHMVVALLIPVIALGLPIMDTALAILRRWSLKLPFSVADRQHIHHKLLAMGLTHRQTVLALYVACFFFAALSLLTIAAKSEMAAVVLIAFGGVVFLGARIFGRPELAAVKKRLADDFESRRRRNRERVAVNVSLAKMQDAKTVSDIWNILLGTIRELDLDAVEVNLVPPFSANGSDALKLQWARNERLPENSLWSANFTLQSNGHNLGRLALKKNIDRSPLSPEVPEMLDLLRHAASHRIEKVSAVSSNEKQRLTSAH